jgi:hypothetical protein
VFCQQ